MAVPHDLAASSLEVSTRGEEESRRTDDLGVDLGVAASDGGLVAPGTALPGGLPATLEDRQPVGEQACRDEVQAAADSPELPSVKRRKPSKKERARLFRQEQARLAAAAAGRPDPADAAREAQRQAVAARAARGQESDSGGMFQKCIPVRGKPGSSSQLWRELAEGRRNPAEVKEVGVGRREPAEARRKLAEAVKCRP